ncbi:helix-turn-helix domain-containing protein [Pseudenhygromyxa sp. WMMC2535]|uniref:helix-turn-helix transcriptional regulator n=1 Tax=Pseudenhygromyxa sp. WMMC2535 TaxID=2712867 RepID=UPI0015535B1D|nr:AraC family transcriptional regulator [Pseudenhygromyxa sp. WMMC2535]NVB40960.1 helix-turn-helix domain-containing protein [Pseudenhygromyxa sp. WMMC2535]
MHAAGSPLEINHGHLASLPWHPPRSHTDHVLTYVAAGSLEMNLGETVVAEPGSILLLPAGTPHEPLGGEDLELWMVRFCASCFVLDEDQPLMAAFHRVRRGALPMVLIPRERRRRVLDLLADLASEQHAGHPESRELLRCMLLLLLAEVRRAMPAAPLPARASSFVPDALAFIQRNGLQDISLRDVAAAVGRAPAHVAATIKRQTGYTVGAWISSIRLAEATSRLVHTDDSIAEIAQAVGWADQTHFIRQFRKAYATTPAAWRREHRLEHCGSRAQPEPL